jgi:hypothetical protein
MKPSTEDENRAHHDMGGVPKYMCLPVEIGPHGLTRFDREVDALRQVLGMKGVMTVDEMRRGIEALPASEYDLLSYYQRWIRSIMATLLRKDYVTEAELLSAMDEA